MTTEKVIYEGTPGKDNFYERFNFHPAVCSPEIGARQFEMPSCSDGIVTTRYSVGEVTISYQVTSADEQSGTPRRVRVILEGEGNLDEIEMKIRDAEEKSKKTQAGHNLGLVGTLAAKH